MDDAERAAEMHRLLDYDEQGRDVYELDPPTDPVLKGAVALIDQYGAWADPTLGPDGAVELAALVLRRSGLVEVLVEARAEIDRWGFGDFHYGDTPRDPGVLAMLAKIDTVLDAPRGTEGEAKEEHA